MSQQSMTTGLIGKAGVGEVIADGAAGEAAWIEVIEKMDEVYADLVRYQLELEEKNAALEAAHEELRQAQQQMVFSEKMAALGRLVAGVAHELNNPISFVFGNMYVLKRYGERMAAYLQAVDGGAAAGDLEALRRELKIDKILKDISPLVEGTLEGAERISEIVQDLRRFSGGQEEPLEEFDLVRVARTATRWVVKTAPMKPKVELDAPEALVAFGRKGAVHQILVNLVQNAVDVTANLPAPAISISCRAEGDEAVVRVRDNGPGVAAADASRIFEPFFTTKPIGEGTGLGLYVSYGLAKEQGGRLEFSKDRVGGGAEFSLRLPRVGPGDGGADETV